MEIRDGVGTLLPVDILFLEQAPPDLAEQIGAEGVVIHDPDADTTETQ